MPAELSSRDEFVAVLDRAVECRAKLGWRNVPGQGRVKVLKLKARTPGKLYTIVFDDVNDGIEFAKFIKDKCRKMSILDKDLEGKI